MENFRNNFICIDNNGIDLLRNNFPVTHYDFKIVKSVAIYNGYLLKNRYFILLFGVVLIFTAIKLLIFEFEGMGSMDGFFIDIGFVKILIMPLFLICFSVYCILQSVKRSPILKINVEAKEHHIRIYEFKKQGILEDLVSFLDKKVMLESY